LVAVASVLGGLFGAGGAALAVYLTLSGQRKEERHRIVYAVVREVMEFARLVIGNLKICENIHMVPSAALPLIMRMPRPVIYPAIADRLGLLNNPTAVVTFFTKMSVVESMVAVIGAQPDMLRSIPREIVQAWIDICEMGKCILMAEPEAKREVDRRAREDVLKKIEEAVASARKTFPEEVPP
jgi:hypothetical protein